MRRCFLLPVLALVACSSSDPATPATESPDAAASAIDAGATVPLPAVDAATVDPLSTDRTLFFGASRCAGLLFCDDFESGAIDTARWQAMGSTKPVVDGTQHARGGKALHVALPGSGASYVLTKAPFPHR